MAVARQGNCGFGHWGPHIWFGKVAEVGGVVAEVVGLAHGHFLRLVGLEVESTGDSEDTGQIGRSVHVPTLVSAGMLEDPLPAAAKPPECISIVLGVKLSHFLEQPVHLEAVPGVNDKRGFVRSCIEEGKGRVFIGRQGVSNFVRAGAVIVEVQP